MKMLTAKVVDGHLDLPVGELPEGATVTLLLPDDDEPFMLTEDQRRELKKSIGQADRGETIDAWEFLRSLQSDH